MKKNLIFVSITVVMLLSGCAKSVDPTVPDTTQTAVFQQGVDGYNGTQDTTIDSANPSDNFGDLNYMRVEHTISDTQNYALLKFDLSYLPAGTIVKSASLTLALPDNSGEATVIMSRMGGAWNQNTAVFSNVSQGAQAVLSSTVLTGNELSLTLQLPRQMVQEWVNNPGINYGVIFKEAGGPSIDGALIYSSEAIPSQLAPKLEITYER